MSTEDPSVHRRRLAGMLKHLRLDAQLSARELGEAYGWSQSKVSKIENGHTIPKVDDVRNWLDHPDVKASDDVRAELLGLASEVSTQATAWREVNKQGFDVEQRKRAERDTDATAIAIYQSEVVAGFLQTPEYARRVFEVHSQVEPAGVPAAVLARMERQAILFDESKKFDFILTESALRWRPGSIAVSLAQLDRIGSLAKLPNVTVGVVPWANQAVAKPLHSFAIVRYGEYVEVQVETLTAELTAADPGDVEAYEAFFEHQRDHAVYDAALDDLLSGVAADLRALIVS